MKIRIPILAVLLLFPYMAASHPHNSIPRFSQDTSVVTSKWYQYGRDKMSFKAVPVIAAGVLLINRDHAFRELMYNYIPNFKHSYDDYLQYAPAALMFGLKIAGVEGRSSWGRMVVSDVFSAAALFTVVQTLKSRDWVKRPDGANYHSFPSGHTATAFMTATMLHREYGLTRSPWYSIGAYSTASIVGLSRQMNNRHWLSDVMVGAGLGVLAAELGYYLSGLIFKDKGIIRDWLPEQPYDRNRRPSFIGLYMGASSMLGNYSYEHRKVSFSTGCAAGLEGAWFITKRFGIGGVVGASTIPFSTEGDPHFLNISSAYVGPYFSLSVAPRWLLGAKAVGGINYNVGSDILREVSRVYPGIGTGVSTTYISGYNFGLKLFADYYIRGSFSSDRMSGHNLLLGGAVNVMF